MSSSVIIHSYQVADEEPVLQLHGVESAATHIKVFSAEKAEQSSQLQLGVCLELHDMPLVARTQMWHYRIGNDTFTTLSMQT